MGEVECCGSPLHAGQGPGGLLVSWPGRGDPATAGPCGCGTTPGKVVIRMRYWFAFQIVAVGCALAIRVVRKDMLMACIDALWIGVALMLSDRPSTAPEADVGHGTTPDRR